MADEVAISSGTANSGVGRTPEPDSQARPSVPVSDPIQALPGLKELWSETRGNPDLRPPTLDGPVDGSHSALKTANLRTLPGLVSPEPLDSPATRHGTHIASVIFGQQQAPVRGIAPGCRGVVIPI